MIKEKHVLKNPYNHHALSRYIDVYEVTTDGCSSSPMSGYKGTEATLVDDPAWNEKFSSYSITGATLTGNNFILNNDVTAKANYETAKNVTTVRCNSTKNSGFIGDTASLSNSSPAWNEKFSSYSITGSTLTGSNFKFTGSNITAKANFETAKNVTLQTDGHGTIASTKSSGFINDTATLSNTASNGYGFSGYSITGATLTGSNFKFTGSNITAKANFKLTGVDYYSNNTRFCVAAQQSHSLPLNVDITQTNYVVAKYDVEFHANPSDYFYNNRITLNLHSNVARTPTTAGSMTAKTNDFTANYGNQMTFTDSGTFRFIIDRSANSISGFYGDQSRFSSAIKYSYLTGNLYTTATAYADSINKITEMYWRSTGSRGQQCISNIKIGGTTSISDALNY